LTDLLDDFIRKKQRRVVCYSSHRHNLWPCRRDGNFGGFRVKEQIEIRYEIRVPGRLEIAVTPAE
jgi:hypothetical protein